MWTLNSIIWLVASAGHYLSHNLVAAVNSLMLSIACLYIGYLTNIVKEAREVIEGQEK